MAQKYAATLCETPEKALIRIIKTNEWIFNKQKRFSYNEETKANLWLHIRAQLAEAGFNVIDPKARWTQLRDLFVRHDRNGNRNWLYYKDMSFMLDHIQHKVKPPSRNTELPVTLGVENSGDQASGSRSFLQQTPLLAAATSTHHVENEVRTLNVAEIVGLSISSCGSSGLSMQQDHSGATSDISEFQLIGHVQPMSQEYEADFEMDFNTQLGNDIQMPSSSPTVETSSRNMSWGQTSATLKTLTMNSTSSPEIAIVEDSTRQSSYQTGSPVCLPTRSFVGAFERPSPFNTATKLNGNSTGITPHAETAQNSPSRFSTTTNKSPRKGTLISGVQATNSTKRFGEPSRASIHLAKKNTQKIGDKRRMVVPSLDAFATKKMKALSKSEATEDAIIECSKDLKEMTFEFKDFIKMKKDLMKARLKGETETPVKRPTLDSEDGFFNLLQKEWIDLPDKTQDELFPAILDIMEEFEGSTI